MGTVKETSAWRFCFFDSCHTASSAGRPFFSSTDSLLFFLHHLLISKPFEAPALSLDAPPSACALPLLPCWAPCPLPHFFSHTALHSLLSPFCHNTPALQGDTCSGSIMFWGWFVFLSIKLSKLSLLWCYASELWSSFFCKGALNVNTGYV